MSENRTGKKIYEIDALIDKLKDESWFVVSHDSITKRVPALALAEYINGDDEKSPSKTKYYSSQKIEEKLQEPNNSINDFRIEINNLKERINQFGLTIVQNNNAINDQIDTIQNSITQIINNTEINKRTIDSILERLDSLESSASSGTTIITGNTSPTQESVPEGTVYIQYFE